MPRGYVTAFYLFDIGDAIELPTVQTLLGATVAAPLTARPAAPPYLQYLQPPLVVEGPAIGIGEPDGVRLRFKAFDYGVLSVALSQPLPLEWEAFVEEGLGWQDNARLAALADERCRALLERIRPAVTRPHDAFLTEDYIVFVVHPDAEGAEQLLASHGGDIAQLLRAEREPLSPQEREEVLRHRISYLATDVVIATWSSAFVYDREVSAQAAIDLLEFANSQLLEFRFYDRLLDGELAEIYLRLQSRGRRKDLLSRRHTAAARHVHALYIDVNELTDKTENALKIAGDVYAARLFGMAAARLGLDQWKGSVRQKLKTLDDIYRFAVEHASMTRGEVLELTIVLLIVLEIALALLNFM